MSKINTLKFKDHYTEAVPKQFTKLSRSKIDIHNLKTNMWNEFVDSDLAEILDADCSVFPRVLPGSYLPVIKKTARDISEAVFKLISLSETEIRAIFPSGPNRDFLLNELKVVKYRPDRLVGSLRFDMAIVGEPTPNNPPKLLEINEIGFDGLSRMPFIQDVLYKIIPGLDKKYFSLDTSRAEIKNMARLGPSLARFQQDQYNWDEELLYRKSKLMKYDLKLISPTQLKCRIDKKEYPLAIKDHVVIKNGRIHIGDWTPSGFMVSFALELSDYKKYHDFFAELVRKKAPHYGPFVTGLFASKSILSVLADPAIQRITLGSTNRLKDVILPAQMLNATSREAALLHPEEFVIKHVDGFGGYHVFMDNELVKTIKKTSTKKFNNWVLQERVKINCINIDGFKSKPKRTIADLGVFCHYDWSHGKFNHFEVGGFLSRATNMSWKVNVSSGGSQVGVMFTKD